MRRRPSRVEPATASTPRLTDSRSAESANRSVARPVRGIRVIAPSASIRRRSPRQGDVAASGQLSGGRTPRIDPSISSAPEVMTTRAPGMAAASFSRSPRSSGVKGRDAKASSSGEGPASRRLAPSRSRPSTTSDLRTSSMSLRSTSRPMVRRAPANPASRTISARPAAERVTARMGARDEEVTAIPAVPDSADRAGDVCASAGTAPAMSRAATERRAILVGVIVSSFKPRSWVQETSASGCDRADASRDL